MQPSGCASGVSATLAGMSIERTFRCDGPDCERHVVTQKTRPPVFLTVDQFDGPELHFCGWDCVLRHAASIEPETIIPSDAA